MLLLIYVFQGCACEPHIIHCSPKLWHSWRIPHLSKKYFYNSTYVPLMYHKAMQYAMHHQSQTRNECCIRDHYPASKLNMKWGKLKFLWYICHGLLIHKNHNHPHIHTYTHIQHTLLQQTIPTFICTTLTISTSSDQKYDGVCVPWSEDDEVLGINCGIKRCIINNGIHGWWLWWWWVFVRGVLDTGAGRE